MYGFDVLKREASSELLSLSKEFPVVGVTGPRQSGKTTLVKMVFPDLPYINLERPDLREVALSDPVSLLKKYQDGAIFDEAQLAPELFSYIQDFVDNNPKNGRFVLTGSSQFKLHEKISQSLAGRIGLLSLLPLTLDELKQAQTDFGAPNDLLVQGFFPKIYAQNASYEKTYRNYIETYLEKDVRLLINIKDISNFSRFLKLCAGRVGTELNYASLANDLGVSVNTIRNWISALEASYIIYLLPPYYENFGKRLVKSPKLYFTDVGLACHLLDIHTPNQVDRDPLRGSLIENLCVIEILKYRFNLGKTPNIYFWRDNNQNEVDLIFKTGNDLIPIEIKASQTFHSRFLKHLKYFENLVQTRCPRGYVLYAGDLEQNIGKFKLLNIFNSKEAVMEK